MHGVGIGIDLGDENVTFGRKIVQNRSNGLAWSAPFCPEINQNPFVLVDCTFKLRISDRFYFAHATFGPPSFQEPLQANSWGAQGGPIDVSYTSKDNYSTWPQ